MHSDAPFTKAHTEWMRCMIMNLFSQQLKFDLIECVSITYF